MRIEIERAIVKHGYLTKIDVCVNKFDRGTESINDLIFLRNLEFGMPTDWMELQNIERFDTITNLELINYGPMVLNGFETNMTFFPKKEMGFKIEAVAGGMDYNYFQENKEDYFCFCIKYHEMTHRFYPDSRSKGWVFPDWHVGPEEVNVHCGDLCHKLRCIHQYYDGIMEKFCDFCTIYAYIWVDKKRVLETEEGRALLS